MKSVKDMGDRLEQLFSSAGNGYCNCPGLLLRLKAGNLPAGLFYTEPEPGCFVLLEEYQRYFRLYLTGGFSGPVALENLVKPAICSHIRGPMPVIERARLFRRFTQMTRPVENRPVSLSVETAGPQDIPRMLALFEQSLPPVDLIDDEALKNAVSQGLCPVLRREGKIAAGAVLTLQGARCTVSNVAVNKSFRRQGMGGQIIDFCLAKSAELGAKSVMLWVNCENTAAVRLYESRGFRSRQTGEQWIVDPLK